MGNDVLHHGSYCCIGFDWLPFSVLHGKWGYTKVVTRNRGSVLYVASGFHWKTMGMLLPEKTQPEKVWRTVASDDHGYFSHLIALNETFIITVSVTGISFNLICTP
jgi:hypothetical protein